MRHEWVMNVPLKCARNMASKNQSINGFCFASSGSSAIGDKALFYDVELYTTGAFPLAAPGEAPVITKR
jgi:hypothetical protein